MDLLRQSPSFWQVLRAVLTGTKFSALAYNGFLMALSAAYSEVAGESPKDLQFALSHSPMQVLPASASSTLKEVLEMIQFDGTLTSTQSVMARMALQKLGS